MLNFIAYDNFEAQTLIGNIGLALVDKTEVNPEHISEFNAILKTNLEDKSVAETEYVVLDVWQMLYNLAVVNADEPDRDAFMATVSAMLEGFPVPQITDIETFSAELHAFRNTADAANMSKALEVADTFELGALKYMAYRELLNAIMSINQWAKLVDASRVLIDLLNGVDDETKEMTNLVLINKLFSASY